MTPNQHLTQLIAYESTPTKRFMPIPQKSSFLFQSFLQRMKVVENYIGFPVVLENSLTLKFEIPAPQFFSVVNMQFQNKDVKVEPGWASVKTNPTFTNY